jgi:hypothetical protein
MLKYNIQNKSLFAVFENIESNISSLLYYSGQARQNLFLMEHCSLIKQLREEMFSKRCMSRKHSFKVSVWEPLKWL